MRKWHWQSNLSEILILSETTDGYWGDYNSFSVNLDAEFDKIRFPGIDGVTTYTAALNEPNLSLSGKIIANGDDNTHVLATLDVLIQNLIDAFNPKHTGTLTYTTYSGSYFISARPAAKPVFQNAIRNTIEFTVELYADRPMWFRTDENYIALGQKADTYMPYIFPTVFISRIMYTNVYNNSKNDAYPVITIYELPQRQNNYWIGNIQNRTTGETINLSNPPPANTKIEIDCYTKRIKEYKNLTGEWQQWPTLTQRWINANSFNMMHLAPGDNDILLYCYYPITRDEPSVEFVWNQPVLGVI